MMKLQKGVLVGCAIFAWITGNRGLVSSENPKNTAVVSGTPVTYMNCSHPELNSEDIIWEFTPINPDISQEPVFIASSCSINASHLSDYATESNIDGSCNLLIYDANPSQAGLYRCSSGNSSFFQASADFIVLDKAPSCTTNWDAHREVSESQWVEMNCSAKLYGNYSNIRPEVSWSNSLQECSSDPYSIGNEFGATIKILAMAPTVPSHTCTYRFGLPTQIPPDYAQNKPSYTEECRTRSINVLYPPRAENVNVTVRKDLVNNTCIVLLICSADGFPSPYYYWTLPDGSDRYENPLMISESGGNISGIYVCTARNSEGMASTNISLDHHSYCGKSSRDLNIALIISLTVVGVITVASLTLILCFIIKSCPLYKKYRAAPRNPAQNAQGGNGGNNVKGGRKTQNAGLQHAPKTGASAEDFEQVVYAEPTCEYVFPINSNLNLLQNQEARNRQHDENGGNSRNRTQEGQSIQNLPSQEPNARYSQHLYEELTTAHQTRNPSQPPDRRQAQSEQFVNGNRNVQDGNRNQNVRNGTQLGPSAHSYLGVLPRPQNRNPLQWQQENVYENRIYDDAC